MLEAGIHPPIAITNSGLFSDPEQTYVDSEPYLAKWKYAEATYTPGNNKPMQQVMRLIEVRCRYCNKLLAKARGTVEIKCPRCGKLNTINTEHQKSAS